MMEKTLYELYSMQVALRERYLDKLSTSEVGQLLERVNLFEATISQLVRSVLPNWEQVKLSSLVATDLTNDKKQPVYFGSGAELLAYLDDNKLLTAELKDKLTKFSRSPKASKLDRDGIMKAFLQFYPHLGEILDAYAVGRGVTAAQSNRAADAAPKASRQDVYALAKRSV
jgi:hypothetical protein